MNRRSVGLWVTNTKEQTQKTIHSWCGDYIIYCQLELIIFILNTSQIHSTVFNRLAVARRGSLSTANIKIKSRPRPKEHRPAVGGMQRKRPSWPSIQWVVTAHLKTSTRAPVLSLKENWRPLHQLQFQSIAICCGWPKDGEGTKQSARVTSALMVGVVLSGNDLTYALPRLAQFENLVLDDLSNSNISSLKQGDLTLAASQTESIHLSKNLITSIEHGWSSQVQVLRPSPPHPQVEADEHFQGICDNLNEIKTRTFLN